MTNYRTKEQAFTNLQMPKTSAAEREDREKHQMRINERNAIAAQKIFVPFSLNIEQRKAAYKLRTQGKNLVYGTPNQEPNYALLGCLLHLVEEDGEFVVKSVFE